MNCECEHKRLASEIERKRRQAKAYARMEEKTVVLYSKPDGTYDFALSTDEINYPIVEYITPY